MYFALTFVGLCAIFYLLWRAFGPVSDDDGSTPSASPSSRNRPPIGPDDDPEFLFELDRREKRGDDPSS